MGYNGALVTISPWQGNLGIHKFVGFLRSDDTLIVDVGDLLLPFDWRNTDEGFVLIRKAIFGECRVQRGLRNWISTLGDDGLV